MSRSMTEIFEVETKDGRSLAKILKPEFLESPQVVDRIRLEADILSSVDHPNVVRLLERGTTPAGRPYILLERLAGHTMRRELVRRGALPVLEAVDLVIQALGGIRAVHDLGVIHRDLKPDNLFLCRSKGRERTLKILDFGFAKVLRNPAARIAPLVVSTAEKEFVGAPRFVAPEQLVVGRRVDHRADIYTLGLVLYTLALGREPHHDVDSRRELQRAHLEGRLDSPSPDTVERVSEELLEIIWRATSTHPDERFQTATEFAERLRRFVEARRGQDSPSKRTLTVQQHAEMTAAIEVDPNRAEEIRAGYGILSAGQLGAVDAWWDENIGHDRKTHAKWRALVDLYRDRLRARREP
jgi:serine/threonine-protein kinase